MKNLFSIFYFFLLGITSIAFADDNRVIDYSDEVFPETLLSQFYQLRRATTLSEADLLKGEIAFLRNPSPIIPKITVKNLKEDWTGTEEDFRAKYGYTLAEAESILVKALANAKSEEEKKAIRNKWGYTPKEIAKGLSANPQLTDDVFASALRTQLKLCKRDRQAEEMELVVIVNYPTKRVEEVFRSFSLWPRYNSSYVDSKLLTQDDIKGIDGLKITESQWYHFYNISILPGFQWKGTNRFHRTEQTLLASSINPKAEGEITRVVLRFDLEEKFSIETDFWGDPTMDTPYANGGIEAGSGVVTFEPYIDSDGKIQTDKTLILLKYFMRLTDPRIGDDIIIPDMVRKITMTKFAKDFIDGMKKYFK